MPTYLLLGAGFSRNWGGWLASEAFEFLLGHPDVTDNETLRRVLWTTQSKGGFEQALAKLQAATDSSGSGGENLKILERAVIAMFDAMNSGYETSPSWEFCQDIACSVTKFLTRFEAIFTLNQDLLVERFYLDSSPELSRPDRWSGVSMPGISPGAKTASIIGRKWRVIPEGEFHLDERIQPYFKLHGSSNWIAPDGGATLVIGANKLGTIGKSPLLLWYQREFERRLCSPGARLMVIGYGFRDEHINDVIINAIMKHELKMFVIAPEGADIARNANPSTGGAIYAPGRLDEAFRRGLVGASRRHLSETFRGGNEMAKLVRFLEP